MISMLTFFASRRHTLIRIIGGVVLLFLLVLIVRGLRKPPKVIQLDPITSVIEIPVEKLTTKTVTKYVQTQDRAAVARLMKDNAALNSTVQQLTISLAEAKSSGSGPVIITPPPTNSTPTVVEVPIALKFKDWRLDFQSDGVTANYTLSQKFSIINTLGRNENNVPVNIVRLFEINEKDQRIPIPTIETTTIYAQPTRQHFYVKPTLQGGVAVLPNVTETMDASTTSAFSVSIPWWKRGTTQAVESTRYAYLTPAATFSDGDITLGVMPASVNVGTIKYLPVTDLWFSPYAGVSIKSNQKKFGIVFSTTF